MKITETIKNNFVDIDGIKNDREFNKDRPFITKEEIDFDTGYNFLVETSTGKNLNFTAKNFDKLNNIGKNGYIIVYTSVATFSSDFKIINPDDVVVSSLTNIYSYFINPVDKKIYIKWGGAL